VSWDGFQVDDPITGEPIALATITRDLTELRRQEAALRASEQRMELVVEGVTDAFCVLRLGEEDSRPIGDLLGMRERAALLGGRVAVASAPGEGTVVEIGILLGDPGRTPASASGCCWWRTMPRSGRRWPRRSRRSPMSETSGRRRRSPRRAR
jgi:PAS domain-containing protein